VPKTGTAPEPVLGQSAPTGPVNLKQGCHTGAGSLLCSAMPHTCCLLAVTSDSCSTYHALQATSAHLRGPASCSPDVVKAQRAKLPWGNHYTIYLIKMIITSIIMNILKTILMTRICLIMKNVLCWAFNPPAAIGGLKIHTDVSIILWPMTMSYIPCNPTTWDMVPNDSKEFPGL
jgi:hypothetical protein